MDYRLVKALLVVLTILHWATAIVLGVTIYIAIQYELTIALMMVILFLLLTIAYWFIKYKVDMDGHINTVALLMAYTFGAGADVDECLDKLMEWQEKNGIPVIRWEDEE